MGRRMYSDYFGISENAFSITPDPRYLYMSERHCEALAHLLYGVVESGCFVMLTGEVGTGKTTVCRALLEQLPQNVDVALLLDPPRSGRELLLAICDELHISLRQREAPLRELVDQLNQRLLESHATGRRTVVIIDEAQNIRPDVLEQVRLLTNLETATEKLLHVILVGQPELRQQLADPSLRQVSQRITARYHLQPLTLSETEDYVHHRLTVAGCRQGLFSHSALRQLHQESQGVPRVINILCDRALLGAFANDLNQVGKSEVREAAKVWRDEMQMSRHRFTWRRLAVPVSTAALLSGAALLFVYGGGWSIAAAARAVERAQPSASAKPTAHPAPAVSASDHAPLKVSDAAPAPVTGAAKAPLATSAPTPIPIPTPVAQAAPEPTQATTSPAEMALPEGMSKLVQAERALLDRWGLEPDNKEARLCSSARRNGLECLFGSGSWETLLHYNRPALLTLRRAGEFRYVLLEGIDGEKVSVWSDGTLVTLSREAVSRYWSGDFRLLWHPQPLASTTIGPDSPAQSVQWLSEALDRYEGQKSGSSEAIHFDESMRERIRRVQRSAGLMVDGIAGPYTLSHLRAPYDTSPGPRLHNQQPVS